MEKIVRENLSSFINEKITKSYENKMTHDEMKSMISKMLIKFHKEGGKLIPNMFNWLKINNFGDYQYNRWVKAAVDTLFKRVGGVWVPTNQNLDADQLALKAMNYWSEKFKKEKNDTK